jgi:cell division transport system permease protein
MVVYSQGITMSSKQLKYGKFLFFLISHVRALKDSFKSISQNRSSCFMTIFVIALTVTLPAILYLLLHNFQLITAKWNNKPSASIYLKTNATEKNIQTIISQLKLQANIIDVKYISPSQGLNDFKKYNQFSDVVSLLANNPLPPVINVTFSHIKEGTPFIHSLQKASIVDQIKIDTDWIQKMHSILSAAKRIIFTLALLLALGVILIVSNTIRLNTQAHRQEMQILKLMGATNAYIRRPFLYNGLFYGSIGGLLALGITFLMFAWISPPILTLFEGNPTMQPAQTLFFGTTVIGIAILLSIAGSWLAIQRFLTQQTG